jgi:hypothetical protein
MGEQSPFAVVTAQAGYRAISGEVYWDSADKLENHSGWSLRGAADWQTGPLTLGAAVSHRKTSGWSKTVGFARAGVRSGPLWLLASIAPDSRNMEAKLEARVTLRHRWAVVELRPWTGWHRTAEELGGYAFGVETLIGVAR